MKTTILLVVLLFVVMLAYWLLDSPVNNYSVAAENVTNEAFLTTAESNRVAGSSSAQSPGAQNVAANGYQQATLAGGCFWCMEPPYDKLPGVISTISGYAGGHVENPTYRAVTSGRTGHTEVVQVTYDPSQISYAQLLEVFWENIDPTTPDRQFCDRGNQYRTAIFAHNQAQLDTALRAKRDLETADILPGPVVTQIETLKAFYPAEEYHQDYYRKNALRYNLYRTSCGRDARLAELWGDKKQQD